MSPTRYNQDGPGVQRELAADFGNTRLARRGALRFGMRSLVIVGHAVTLPVEPEMSEKKDVNQQEALRQNKFSAMLRKKFSNLSSALSGDELQIPHSVVRDDKI